MTGKYWKRICAIPAYMFLLSPSGNRVQKMEGGNWIDQHEAQKVIDAAEEELTGLLAERDALKAECESLRCVEPNYEDVERLCRVLGYLGVSTPESGEESAARWLSLVRTLIRTAETSKLLRQDAEKVAEYTHLKAECEGLRKALIDVFNHVEGNTECLVRDLVNWGTPQINPNDFYGECEAIKSIVQDALGQGGQSNDD
jgi:hypothetical protein